MLGFSLTGVYMKIDEEFDEFLNRVLNMVGVYEEKVCKDISKGELTLKEIRIIENVLTLAKEGDVNIGDLATSIFLSPSALSIAVSTLCRKGYLKKMKKNGDQRYSFIVPTDKAREISKIHRAYHAKLFNYIYNKCNPEDLHAFTTVIKEVERSLGGK